MNEKTRDGFKILKANKTFTNISKALSKNQEIPSRALTALKTSISMKSSPKKLSKKLSSHTMIIDAAPSLSNDASNDGEENKKQEILFSLSCDPSLFHCETAWDLYQSRCRSTDCECITCCNREIDDLFVNNGVPLGKITEFVGLSGTGKTQIGLQLSCDVQIPTALNGCGGQCIYIDTANGVIGQRLYNISKSFIRHIHQMAQRRAGLLDTHHLIENVKEELNTERDMLSNILIFRCFDFNELDYILMKLLDEILSGKNKTYSSKFHKVKLIVIDPISFLIKYQDNITQYILKCGELFSYLCKKYNVAIVCMNQMTTKMITGNKGKYNNKNNKNKKNKNKKDNNYNFHHDDDDNFDVMPLDAKYVIVPGLGYVWSSIVNIRIQLLMIQETRYAKLLKTCQDIKTNKSGRFKISVGGIRNFKADKRK